MRMLESIKKNCPGPTGGEEEELAEHTHITPAYAHVTAHLHGDKHLKRGHLLRPTSGCVDSSAQHGARRKKNKNMDVRGCGI